jgi:hypothetical protein
VKTPQKRTSSFLFQGLVKVYQQLTKADLSFHTVSRFSQPLPAAWLPRHGIAAAHAASAAFGFAVADLRR